MPSSFIDSRRDLRERAFQALFSLEFTKDLLLATTFAYSYDKSLDEEQGLDIPLFLLSLTQGVFEKRAELDKELAKHLKVGWSMERLTLTDKTLLRLGLYEMRYYDDTPDRIAINEIIEIAKKYADETSGKFVNGMLSQFVSDED